MTKREDINVFPFEAYEYPFNLEHYGITETVQPYVTVNDPCRNYIIEYIVKGKGTLVYNDKIYHPKKGDMYILHKGSKNQYYTDRDDPWTKYWFNADGALVVNLLMSYGLYDTIFIENFNRLDLFEEMYKLSDSDLPISDILHQMSIKFHNLLITVYNHINKNLVRNSANDIKYILDSSIYSKDFKMKDLSEMLHLSQTHIINTFKEVYNQTPYRYYMDQKIHVSATMLLNTELSIKEISETLNFSDQHYFSNAFKKSTGKAPQQYRKENQRLYNQLLNLNLKKHSSVGKV